MSTLAQQLHRLGLVTEGQARVHEAQRDLEAEARQKRQRKQQSNTVTEEELRACQKVKQFRSRAKDFLLQGGDIQVVIRVAHQFDDKRLVGQLYGLRENLGRQPENKHAKLIRRALRGAGRRHNRDI